MGSRGHGELFALRHRRQAEWDVEVRDAATPELLYLGERVEFATGVDDLDRLAPSDRRAAGLEPPVVVAEVDRVEFLGKLFERGVAVTDAGVGLDGQR